VSGNGTIGGMIGAGLAGPRRIKAGGARDHLLGAHAVSGFGDSFKTGGRVVKNVTGYDLCKLLTGSWGTLAVMTEVTLKVMPKPESERTLVLAGLDDVTANRAMTAALGSPYDVSGAAHLPGSVFGTATGALARLGAGGRAVTLLRLEGIAASVADRAGSLGKVLATFGAVETLQDDASAAVWAAVRDVDPFAASGARGLWPVWRIVCPPASGGALGQMLARKSQGDVIYDWGGGLIWAAVPPKPDARASVVRQRVDAAGGHAMGAARDLRGAPRHAAFAAGQAAVVAHVAAHDLGAAAYAIKAVRAAAGEDAGRRECRWQRDQLPDAVRELVLDDQRARNDLCWSVFDC